MKIEQLIKILRKEEKAGPRIVRVSLEMLRDSDFNWFDFLRDAFAKRMVNQLDAKITRHARKRGKRKVNNCGMCTRRGCKGGCYEY